LGLPAGALIFLGSGRSWALNRRWLLLFAAVVGLVALVVSLGWGERLANSETVLRRFAIWQGAFDLWRAHPLLGVGPGGFFWTYPAFMAPAAAVEPDLIHAHNLWLNLLTGWGVFGLLWLAGLLCWLYGQWQATVSGGELWIQIGVLASMAAALAHAQVDAFLVLPELAAWNWIAFASLAQLEKTRRESKTKL
jgi:O-antigen ligase